MAILRMLYAYFRIKARLFLDFLAGDLSSRNVSSNIWCSRFSFKDDHVHLLSFPHFISHIIKELKGVLL